MPCCCNQCSETPEETWCESHRHKTEVEYVSKQTGSWIKEFLDGIEKVRGSAARDRLRSDVYKLWKLNK
jgi:hypothetical protein